MYLILLLSLIHYDLIYFPQMIPQEVFDAPTTEKLRQSFMSDSNDGKACAESAQLWEVLLEIKRHPFLLLVVADMRTALNSPVTGLQLYQEVRQAQPVSKFQCITAQYISCSSMCKTDHTLIGYNTTRFQFGEPFRRTASLCLT